jgi:hypothetical protein
MKTALLLATCVILYGDTVAISDPNSLQNTAKRSYFQLNGVCQ